jgi:two-component system OmpR family sensor kinase
LDQVAKSAIEEFHRRFPQHVTLDADRRLPFACGSLVQIERVLANLLSNAGRYSPQTDEIGIKARVVDNAMQVDVLDRGPGLVEEEITQMFDPFERLSAREETRGYGLGLAISKRLVEANGGRIWANKRDNGGLDVGFSLPLYQE